MDTATQGPSQLLELPAELRNLIYEFTVASHDSVQQPTLFRTCRQRRNEALDLFYSTHRFRCESPHVTRQSIKAFEDRVGEERTKLIRHVTFRAKAYHIANRQHSQWSATIELHFTKSISKTSMGPPTWTAEFSRQVSASCRARLLYQLAQYHKDCPEDRRHELDLLYDSIMPFRCVMDLRL